MGKGKAQRTKNNTKPSSSSRSAELLGKQFDSFSGLPLSLAESSSSYSTELLRNTMSNFNFSGQTISKDELEMFQDPNFLIVLRKMGKKNEVTRYKALQEFSTLCQTAALPVVQGVLPSWSRLYCILSVDIDNKVREATQVAHAVVVNRVNQDIMTYLEQIAAAWFISQYDTYPPAASAAINSFNTTFPCKKLNVIIPYQHKILSYIYNNIIHAYPLPKYLHSQEVETVHERLYVASLQGYSSYFEEVEYHECLKSKTIHFNILSVNSNFWSLHKHDASQVRTAFFNALSSVIRKAPYLLSNEKERIVSIIINNLNSDDPRILSAVWDLLLLVIDKYDYLHDVSTELCSTLWHVLQSNNPCCTKIVLPNLLLLVNKFPKLAKNTDYLYMNFFDNMRNKFYAGIQMKENRWNMQPLIKAFIECLRFSIHENCKNAENVDLCIQLLKNQLMPVIEECMKNDYTTEYCFPEIVDLIRHWNINRTNEEYLSYVSLIQQFWIELRLLFDKFINMPKSCNTTVTNVYTEFLLILKNPPSNSTDKKNMKKKVKFFDSNNPIVDPQEEPTVIDSDNKIIKSNLLMDQSKEKLIDSDNPVGDSNPAVDQQKVKIIVNSDPFMYPQEEEPTDSNNSVVEQEKIKFIVNSDPFMYSQEEEPTNLDDSIKDQSEIKQVSTKPTKQDFDTELCDFVNALCIAYFKKIKINEQFMECITQLNNLIENFGNSKELFKMLLELYKIDNDFEFYTKELEPLLWKSSEEDMKRILDLIFYFIIYTRDSNTKEKILKSLVNINKIEITINVIRCSLAERFKNDHIIKKWCIEADITGILSNTARRIVNSHNHKEIEECQGLILLILEGVDLSVKKKEINEAISILCDAIKNAERKTSLEQFVVFMTDLMNMMWRCSTKINNAYNILNALFELYVQMLNSQDYDDSDLTFVRDKWKEGFIRGVESFDSADLGSLIKKWAVIIWREVYSMNTVMDIWSDLSAIILHIISSGFDNYRIKPNDIENFIILFLTASDIQSQVAEATDVALYGEAVTGNTLISYFPNSLWQPKSIRCFYKYISVDSEKHIISDTRTICLRWALFTTKLINKLYNEVLGNPKSDALVDSSLSAKEEDTEEDTQQSWNLPGIIEILINIMHIASIVEMYNKNYEFIRYDDDVNELLKLFNDSFVNMQKNFSKDLQCQLLYKIQSSLQDYGDMTPYLIRTYYAKFKKDENPIKTFYEGFRYSKIHDEDIYMQGINLLSNYCTPEDIPLISNFANMIYKIINARLMVDMCYDDRHFEDDNIMYTSVLNNIMDVHNSFDYNHDFHIPNKVEIMKLYTTLIKRIPLKLTIDYWNFILSTFLKWLDIAKKEISEKIEEEETYLYITEFKRQNIALVIAACQLFYELQNLMNKHEKDQISEVIAEVHYNWKNKFAYNIYNHFAEIWISYADLHNEDRTMKKSIIVLDYLGKAITAFNKNIFKYKLIEYSEAEEIVENIEDKKDAETSDEDLLLDLKEDGFENVKLLKEPVSKKLDIATETVRFDIILNSNKQIKYLQSSIPNIQLGAYHALKHTVSEFVQYDKILVSSDKFNIKNKLHMKKFEKALLNTQDIVNKMLKEYKPYDRMSCTNPPDCHTCILGYLLTWAIVLDFCANADSDLRYQYTIILKDKLFPCLLDNIFKIMPLKKLQENNKDVKLLFNDPPSFNFGENWTKRLDHIVIWLYINCLRYLPVLVRQWWNTNSKISAIIDKITSCYISPMLCQEEFSNKLTHIDNMQVKVYPTTREVIALYKIEDDAKLELTIVLPSNYPLGKVEIKLDQNASKAHSKDCQKQLSIFLERQNGSIWQGIKMWKHDLDKKFAGIEECCICLNIFHISTHQIPKISCKTCRKKFHTTCVYKWFHKNQQASCPTCRDQHSTKK